MLKYFSIHSILADAITAHPTLIQLLPRFNISLGFGDKSISDICKQANIDAIFFTMACNIYAFESYRPSLDDIIAINPAQLISYLKKSHTYYFSQRIPHIENHLDIITTQIDKKQGAVLKHFFSQYKNEVKNHFDYEENTIFTMLSNFNQGNSTYIEFNGFGEAHTDIEDTMNDLIQIIFRYLPSNIEQENSIGMAFDILQLADDLKKHALIEEIILLPVIKHLERRITQ